jgi:hypothetical protein
MQLHAGKISTNSTRRGLVATSLMLTATDQASLLLRSSNNNRSTTLYQMRLILCSLLQLLHGLGFRMTTLGWLLLTNRSILTHSTLSQFLNQESIDIPVSSSQGRGLHSCATLPVGAIVPQQHVASSIESQAFDGIIYNREALGPLGHRDCSSSVNNLANAVCTRYEQSGRTPESEWISNPQVLTSSFYMNHPHLFFSAFVFEVARSAVWITILAYPCHRKSESRDSWSNLFPLDD